MQISVCNVLTARPSGLSDGGIAVAAREENVA
jgi:hypothetical protein